MKASFTAFKPLRGSGTSMGVRRLHVLDAQAHQSKANEGEHLLSWLKDMETNDCAEACSRLLDLSPNPRALQKDPEAV
jgi:hypothetical protein